MLFEWDEAKNLINHNKHEVWFEEGQTIWADEYSKEFYDSDHSHTEDRFIRIGYSSKQRLLLVVFCERKIGNIIRIISVRKATLKERKDYER